MHMKPLHMKNAKNSEFVGQRSRVATEDAMCCV